MCGRNFHKFLPFAARKHKKIPFLRDLFMFSVPDGPKIYNFSSIGPQQMLCLSLNFTKIYDFRLATRLTVVKKAGIIFCWSFLQSIAQEIHTRSLLISIKTTPSKKVPFFVGFQNLKKKKKQKKENSDDKNLQFFYLGFFNEKSYSSRATPPTKTPSIRGCAPHPRTVTKKNS